MKKNYFKPEVDLKKLHIQSLLDVISTEQGTATGGEKGDNEEEDAAKRFVWED